MYIAQFMLIPLKDALDGYLLAIEVTLVIIKLLRFFNIC